MKKFLSAILAMLMVIGVFSVSASTEATEEVGANYDTMLIEDVEDPYAQMPKESDEEVIAEMPEKEMHHGVVSEITEEYILLNDGKLRVNLAPETYISDYSLNPAEIKKGDAVSVLASTMMTRSLPPQVAAYNIFVNTENSQAAPIYAVVGTNTDGKIESEDCSKIIAYTEETPVTAHRMKIILKGMDITPGSEIIAFASVMTMSEPALINAESLAVLTLAKAEEPATIIEAMPEKVSVSGIVSEIGEGYVQINDGNEQFNLAEETYICDYNLNPAELKVGDMITVVAGSAMTMSLPPQMAAHYIFVNTEDSVSAPIYAVVGSNENGVMMSLDGANRIVYEEATPVIAHRIRMMIKANDITEGSEIVVFASVVGMSLPAHVAAEKIAVLSLAPVKTDVSAVVVDGEEFNVEFNFGSTEAKYPLRALAEGLGFEVIWNNEERSINLKKGEAVHSVKIGEALTMARVAGVLPVIVNDLTYVGDDIFNLLFGNGAKVAADNGIIEVTTK
ncbi:MAG: copper amine oxidase N-terminal domain-containing protein [Clostridia bacterium]|nr:copper amine oxidase N-terminal domain-containing protein [Clostridia bacterium]